MWRRGVPLSVKSFVTMTSNLPDVAANLSIVRQKLEAAVTATREEKGVDTSVLPRLVAVSKTKPKELVIAAYDAGHRDFGENYVQELLEKSEDAEVRARCPDIRWRYIGACQTNKLPKLLRVPNLTAVETLTSQKHADKLQTACKAHQVSLDVMVQVNTSGEANKNGMKPADVLSLAKHIKTSCPNLKFAGVMTIGALGHSLASSTNDAIGETNPDFLGLIQCRKEVAQGLECPEDELELSMGMSNDFEEAIRSGSTSVRVGSSIFGARQMGTQRQVESISQKMTVVAINE